MKVLTIVGTRPEIIKLSRIIPELDAHFQHVLLHTGQNADFELNRIFFEELRIREPNHVLRAARDTPMASIAEMIDGSDRVMDLEKPDAVLVLGDTNSGLSVIAAKRRRIPIFHLEAGNRCFDERVPEEVNRRIIDHVSDINLPYTEHARRHLLREGFRPDLVIKIGSPMREVLEYYRGEILASSIVERLDLRRREYFVVSSHREENVDDPTRLTNLVGLLGAVAKRYARPVIVSTHPRTRRRLAEAGFTSSKGDMVSFLAPLGFFDYVRLQMDAACVLSDSGTISEESAILGFPAVTIRESHERPEGMDEGVLAMSGLTNGRVLEAVELMMKHADSSLRPKDVVDYSTKDVSSKVSSIILSYTDYVNRTIWFKGF